MYRRILYILIGIACTVFVIGCSKTDLRGSFKRSSDGQTYLVVDDDNGGHCGPIKVDGTNWPHRIGEPGEIEPGHHIISCGGDIDFNIPRGVTYRFNYWGP